MEGTCFESDWAAVAAGTSALRSLLGRLHQAGSERLGPMFAELDELKLLAEAGQVSVLVRGCRAGTCRPRMPRRPRGGSAHGPHSYAAGGAAALVQVTVAIAQERNRVLREAVLAARAPVRNAAVALAEMDKLRPRLTPECHGTVLEGFVALAEGQGPREIRALRPALIAKYGHLGEFQRREDKLKHGTALSQPYDDDGMAEYRLRLDPEGPPSSKAMFGSAGRAPAEYGARVGHPDAATSAGPRRWSRSAAGPPPPAGPPRPRPRPPWSSRWATRTCSSGPVPRDADRGAARPRDGPQDGLRRAPRPGRPRLPGRGARPRPDRPTGVPETGAGTVDPGPGLHLPRLLEAPILV